MTRQIYIVTVMTLATAFISSGANAIGDRGGITGSAGTTGTGGVSGSPPVKARNWFILTDPNWQAVKPITYFPSIGGKGIGIMILPFPSFGAP